MRAMVNDIAKTCQAIKEAGFPIDLGPQLAVVSTEHPSFDPICELAFQDAIKFQREIRPNTAPRIWTAPLIRTVADYAAKFGIRITVLGPPHPSPARAASITLVPESRQIDLGAMAFIEMDERRLLFGLDHMMGSIRDYQLIEFYYPEIGALLHSEFGAREDAMKILDARFDLLRRQIPEDERGSFDKAARDVFGDFESLDEQRWVVVSLALADLLRCGEEVHDRRLEDVVFERLLNEHFRLDSSSVSFFVPEFQKEDGTIVDVHKLLCVAELQEAGLWEKFTRQPGFNPNSVKHLDPDHIAFFRRCIRAATNYFPVIFSPEAMQPG